MRHLWSPMSGIAVAVFAMLGSVDLQTADNGPVAADGGTTEWL